MYRLVPTPAYNQKKNLLHYFDKMAVSELKASLEKFNNEMLEIKENQKKLQEYCVEIQPMKSSSVLPVHDSADTCLMSGQYSSHVNGNQENIQVGLQIAKLSQQIEELYLKYNVISSAVAKLEVAVDDLEQYERRNCIILHSLTSKNFENANAYEDFETYIIATVNNHFKTNLVPNDIDITHKLPPSKNGKIPVIIKFVNRSTRNQIYYKKQLLAKTGLSITESLTKKRLEMVILAKQASAKKMFGLITEQYTASQKKGKNR